MTSERAAVRRRPVTEPCLNCGDATVGRYCPNCGQRKVNVLVSVRTLVANVLEDQLVVNRTLPRTLAGLLTKPGFLTREYLRGRIARYIAPFRLYLVASFVFFVLVSFMGLRALDRVGFEGATESPADVEAVRTTLLERQQVLAGVDTTVLPASGRAVVRQSLAQVTAALGTLDTTADPDSSTLAAILRRTGDATALAPGTRQEWAENLRPSEPSSLLTRGLARKVDQLGHLPPRDALRAVLADMLRYAPHAMFVLLPVFALLLKLLYIRRGRYYAEHVVFALHLHAFFFVLFTLMLILPWEFVDLVLATWLVLYTWLAMKHVYGQSWFRTTAKWVVLGLSYSVLLSFGLLGLMLSTLLFT